MEPAPVDPAPDEDEHAAVQTAVHGDGHAAVLAVLYEDGDCDEIAFWTVQEHRRGRATRSE